MRIKVFILSEDFDYGHWNIEGVFFRRKKIRKFLLDKAKIGRDSAKQQDFSKLSKMVVKQGKAVRVPRQ